MNKKIVLEVQNLHKSYGSKKVINSLDLKVEQGDVYGFLGPNGSGKTTTIRTILGLVHYEMGSVRLNGYDVKKDFKKAIAKVGSVVETPRFYESCTGRENLEMMADLYGDIPKGRIDEVLEMVGMQKRARDKVKTYSLGMKQRLGIARALLNNPEFVILDEPTNGLDPQGMKEIREMISQLSLERDITFFISTHLLYEVEQICNRVGILKHGQKLAEGSVKELLNKDYETIEVYTGAAQEAENALHNISYIKGVEKSVNGLILQIDKGYSEELTKLLVNRNVPVSYVIPRNQSLENYFIELTEGGEHIA